METTPNLNQKISEIVTYPDHRLLTISDPVNTYGEQLAQVATMMNISMLVNNGVGLSAIQIGIPMRMFVVSKDAFKDLPTTPPCFMDAGTAVFVNPKITEISEEYEVGTEGCLSFPKVFGAVSRPNHIKVHAIDLFGNDFEITAAGLFARVIQHEMDHLDGKIFISRMAPIARDIARRKLKKFKNKTPRQQIIHDVSEVKPTIKPS